MKLRVIGGKGGKERERQGGERDLENISLYLLVHSSDVSQKLFQVSHVAATIWGMILSVCGFAFEMNKRTYSFKKLISKMYHSYSL